jgi:hypothetical protein
MYELGDDTTLLISGKRRLACAAPKIPFDATGAAVGWIRKCRASPISPSLNTELNDETDSPNPPGLS